MSKLWKKQNQQTNPLVETYTAGTDHVFDLLLFPFDIEATLAHAKGLTKIGVLSGKELRGIEFALGALKKEIEAGKITITQEDEDCHTVMENYLVRKLGDTGKKIHTGRSRNDQVLVAMRLYMRTRLDELRSLTLALADDFVRYAETYRDVPMPGYTHTQQAMLSSVGHYMSAHAESLLDDARLLGAVRAHINKNPLGSAAGFGVSIPLDRAYTTRVLGFDSVQFNSLYCQNSRGKFESLYMEALGQVMASLSRFANDMILFTSQEFNFFTVDDSLVEGSSIMPQKRNLDVLEIMRGQGSVVTADHYMIKQIAKTPLSGYNRDLQLIKKPLMESTRIVSDSLEVAAVVLAGMTPNAEFIKSSISPQIFAADIANDLVKAEGMAFRDAYRKAMSLVTTHEVNLEKNIRSKISPGGPGNLKLSALKKKIRKERAQR